MCYLEPNVESLDSYEFKVQNKGKVSRVEVING